MTERAIRAEYKRRLLAAKKEYRRGAGEIKREYRQKIKEYLSAEPLRNAADSPRRTVAEEVGNAVTHGVGAVLAVVALILLTAASRTAEEYAGAVAYSSGLFAAFLTSCLYHSFRYGKTVKRVFRRLDYSSIYLLIGATFAPILLCYVGGAAGYAFFAVQGAFIAAGIALMGVFGPSRFRGFHMTLYFVIGWSGLVFLPRMMSDNLPLLLAVLGGGIAYSLGIVPFAVDKRASHVLWHLFVLAGAAIQWVGIYLYIYLA